MRFCLLIGRFRTPDEQINYPSKAYMRYKTAHRLGNFKTLKTEVQMRASRKTLTIKVLALILFGQMKSICNICDGISSLHLTGLGGEGAMIERQT